MCFDSWALLTRTRSAFDGVVNSYQELAATVLLTLQVEVRCQVIYHISDSLRSNYVLEQPVNDPDPAILALNAELVNFDEDVSTHLRELEHHFLTAGLGLLIDTMLVTNAAAVRTMNAPGCGRMQLNILVLQQNLKNIEADVVLVRSAQYFDFFADGPDAVLAAAAAAATNNNKSLPYAYDELRVVVELCYSDALASPRREVAMQAKRELGDRLLQLSESMWQA